MSNSEFSRICKVSDIPEGKMKIFNKNMIEFVVIHQDSKFYALYNKCPHMGGSLGDGTIDESGYVTCPLHNWQFDGKTGKGPEGYEDLFRRLKQMLWAMMFLLMRINYLN